GRIIDSVTAAKNGCKGEINTLHEIERRGHATVAKKVEAEKSRAKFNALDSNGDGFLSREDVARLAIDQYSRRLTENELCKMLEPEGPAAATPRGVPFEGFGKLQADIARAAQ
ncbi:unnamed protein product, partial [Prorocentrum cordatum]